MCMCAFLVCTSCVCVCVCFIIGFNTILYFPITSVQLTLDRVVGGNPQESLNGYMVAPRNDTGAPLGGSVPYVGSWELETDMRLICNGVSTASIHYIRVHCLLYVQYI